MYIYIYIHMVFFGFWCIMSLFLLSKGPLLIQCLCLIQQAAIMEKRKEAAAALVRECGAVLSYAEAAWLYADLL